MEQNRYLTTKQAAQFLGYSEPYLRQLANEGQIPAYKVRGSWRFNTEELRGWVENGGQMALPGSTPADRTGQ